MGIVYDKIMSAGALAAPPPASSEEVAGHLFGLLRRSVVIDADYTMRYFRTETSDDPDFLPSDVPNLRPPFAVSFIDEDTVPSEGAEATEAGRLVADTGVIVHGFLLNAVDLRDPRLSPTADEQARYWLNIACGPKAYGGDIRWALFVYLFEANPEEELVNGPLINWLLPLKDDGSIELDSGGYDPALISVPQVGTLEEAVLREEFAAAVHGALLSALFVVGAINSPLTDLRPITRHPGQQYVLTADRLTSKLDSVGQARTAGLAHALLACREHFFEAEEGDR